jgi:ankyrin repeat protein
LIYTGSAKGFKEIAALLLQHGANPNMKDFNGFTPLHEAAVSVMNILFAIFYTIFYMFP